MTNGSGQAVLRGTDGRSRPAGSRMDMQQELQLRYSIRQ